MYDCLKDWLQLVVERILLCPKYGIDKPANQQAAQQYSQPSKQEVMKSTSKQAKHLFIYTVSQPSNRPANWQASKTSKWASKPVSQSARKQARQSYLFCKPFLFQTKLVVSGSQEAMKSTSRQAKHLVQKPYTASQQTDKPAKPASNPARQ